MSRYAILIILAFIFTTTAALAMENDPEFSKRFVVKKLMDGYTYIMLDTKTGCEYIRSNYDDPWVLLTNSCPTGNNK